MTTITHWIVSDLHLGHKMLVEKGYRPDNFEDLIVANWNKYIKPQDVVYNLGDVFFAGNATWEKYRPLLPGRHILCVGNHESKSLDWYMQNGFDFACDALMIRKYGLRILLTHKPQSEEKLLHYDVNLHGHLHNNCHPELTLNKKNILYSAELEDYKPVLLQTMIERLQK